MKQSVKLILYYFLYQLTCTCVITFFGYAVQIARQYRETGALAFPEIQNQIPYSIAALLVSNLLFGWHLLRKGYVPANRSAWSPVSFQTVSAVILLTFGTMLWMNYLTEQMNLPDWNEEMFLQMKDHVLGILSIAVVAPVVEEMFFRGAIEGHLLRLWKKPQAAVLASALIFGLIHLNPAQIPFAFGQGVILGWLYYRTQSLVPGILLHLVNNGIGTILMLYAPAHADSLGQLFGQTNALLLAIAGFLVMLSCLAWINRTAPALTQKP